MLGLEGSKRRGSAPQFDIVAVCHVCSRRLPFRDCQAMRLEQSSIASSRREEARSSSRDGRWIAHILLQPCRRLRDSDKEVDIIPES